MKVAHLLLLPAVALAVGHGGEWTHAAHVTTYTQDVQVIDGDTLQVDGKTIQLYGIDAPELGQLCQENGRTWHCGRDAAFKLQKLVTLSNGPLVCSPWPQDGGSGKEEKPAVRICDTEGKDLGLVMLRSGYAVALSDSFPDYVDAQAYARQAKLGLWRGDFAWPAKWRQEVDAQADDPRSECNVKGVVDTDGQRLYYVPTDANYLDINIDPAKGGRMYCSDERARHAGLVRPAGSD